MLPPVEFQRPPLRFASWQRAAQPPRRRARTSRRQFARPRLSSRPAYAADACLGSCIAHALRPGCTRVRKAPPPAWRRRAACAPRRARCCCAPPSRWPRRRTAPARRHPRQPTLCWTGMRKQTARNVAAAARATPGPAAAPRCAAVPARRAHLTPLPRAPRAVITRGILNADINATTAAKASTNAAGLGYLEQPLPSQVRPSRWPFALSFVHRAAAVCGCPRTHAAADAPRCRARFRLRRGFSRC
jgi:hypothetical protein